MIAFAIELKSTVSDKRPRWNDSSDFERLIESLDIRVEERL